MKLPFKMSCGISYALLFSIVFAMASCSKDGDTGPEGPAGPAGPEGPAGEQGPKGDTGTANVIYSGWLDVTFGLNSDSTAFIAEIDAPKIDQEVLATGEVKVYMNLSNASDPFIVPLPYFDGTFLINVRMYEQTINLLSFNNLSTFTDENDGMKYQQARYVIIPGGTAARQAAGIDWNDYQQVKNYLGLKD